MRSESLLRLNTEPTRAYDNEVRRQAIADQVSEFLARGGQIKQIPDHIGGRPLFKFCIGPNAQSFERAKG